MKSISNFWSSVYGFTVNNRNGVSEMLHTPNTTYLVILSVALLEENFGGSISRNVFLLMDYNIFKYRASLNAKPSPLEIKSYMYTPLFPVRESKRQNINSVASSCPVWIFLFHRRINNCMISYYYYTIIQVRIRQQHNCTLEMNRLISISNFYFIEKLHK